MNPCIKLKYKPVSCPVYLLTSLVAGLVLLLIGTVQANTDMFKPIGSAAQDIQINGRGFMINGKPVFVCSGSFHYARVPRALWRDRLLKMKRAGFNTVQTYVFWNFQEPGPGVFDFHGRADLNAFLQLVHQMGMYALVRCGPYDCAEWDDGGYPLWLAFEKGVIVREDDPAFMNPLRKFWGQLLPIVAQNQINHGGAVIMVQLENEDRQGWGTVIPNKYFQDLYDMARHNGIEVPLFFSGMHHGFHPAGNRPWNDAKRTRPWYTTEFWSSPTWYHGYGAMPHSQQVQLNRGIWKIIAFGGSGYNFYMLVGSTNFWLWNDNELAACYDYSSAIGQGGDLRPIYYNMKRANYFARGFADILENSVNADTPYHDFATGVNVLARTGPAGTIVFLDNTGRHAATATLKNGLKIQVAAQAIRPVVLSTKLGKTWSIESSYSRILGVQLDKNVTTLVVYGRGGNQAHITFFCSIIAQLGGEMRQMPHSAGDIFGVQGTFPSGAKPVVATAQISKKVLRVLIENRIQAKHTWFINSSATHIVVVGPAYVGQVTQTGGKLKLRTQTSLDQPVANAFVYGETLEPVELVASGTTSTLSPAPIIKNWQVTTVSGPAQVNFSTAGWLETTEPESMGADGILSPWCWYRAWIHSSAGGSCRLNFNRVANLAAIYVNGKYVTTITSASIIPVMLHAGRNLIAVFTAEHGRTKLYNYLGPINQVLARGIWGSVTRVKKPLKTISLSSWFVKSMSGNAAADIREVKHGYKAGTGWTTVATGTDYFQNKKGYAWYHLQLPEINNSANLNLVFSDVDDIGTFFLNGHKLITHHGWGQDFQVELSKFWNISGPNQLDVLVQNTSGGGGIMGTATLQAGGFEPITPWKMHDGSGVHVADATWQPLTGTALKSGPPRFYIASFNWDPSDAVHAVLRVAYTGLSSGHIIVNGHDLGLYPDATMSQGLYIPSVWLKHGANTLEILVTVHGQKWRNLLNNRCF